MSWLSDAVGGTVSGVIDSISNAVDKFVTTDAEKLQLTNELNRIQIEAEQKANELDLKFQQEITARHSTDMNSDSWLSKNIRPLVLVYLLTAWTIFAGVSISFSIQPEYVAMLKEMLIMAFGFYFVSRGIEKTISIIKKEGKC